MKCANISSVSGFRPQPNNIAYVAAKHGVVGMTKVAAMENGPFNIRVNSLLQVQ
ncbi:SDR family NAD(P)-dependent oxidoreductase [Neobacillus soli]|uniref:SDR family NAD(P)-dependent oxidoreductase n=1 Tax=Neobacillus soli TaxID=220688 RepID=UPI000A97F792|nr:SDR family NAD(P)-dependent oxidoreductase [Neobacillus soli]